MKTMLSSILMSRWSRKRKRADIAVSRGCLFHKSVVVFHDFLKGEKLYVGESAVLDVPGVKDQPVYVGIRPEGFVVDSNGPLTCNLSGVDVMGRDVSLVTTHEASLNPVVRSIVDADAAKNASGITVSYSLKPHKVFLFNKETEERVYF